MIIYFYPSLSEVGTKKTSPVDTPDTESEKTTTVEKVTSPPEDVQESTDKNVSEEVILDSQDSNHEFLEMMGEEVTSTDSELKVDETIEKQWSNWMSKGLPEDTRKELLKKYSRVGKFRTEAPKVNLEIVSHLSEVAKKRDQHFTDTQNAVGTALVSLAAAMSMLMENPEDGIDHTQLMKYLWDSGKTLADVFNQHSIARQSFITPNLDKDIKTTLEATVSDEWLYGTKLTEQVKDAKTIKKAAASLKAPEKLATKKSSAQGNWRGPPGKAKQVGYYPRRQFTNVKYRPRSSQARPSQTTSRSTAQSSSRSTKK